MQKRVYYIDPQTGDDSYNGLTPAQPKKNYDKMKYLPGDTILFKRGSVIRGGLDTCDGSEWGDITYGAYGTGEKPLFLGSVPVDGHECWIEDKPFVWRFTGVFESEVCNLIFNQGEECGNLRWRIEDLKCQGEWHFTCLGISTDTEQTDPVRKCKDGILYVFSERNPGMYYKSMECALWGKRRMVGGKSHVVLENLVFQNGGVHGYQEIEAGHIKIRNCEFKFIGGAVWDRARRIRFGNAVELWDKAQDITVENCVFSDIYDSGVTHQGSGLSGMPERIYFRNNLFVNCGMAAYECRGPAAQEVYFENNTCIAAGGGFAMQGEAPPRQSEIYPQPMGHHVFIWRIDKQTQKGYIYICNNIFYEAPYGAAIYSIIEPEDEAHIVINNNCYYQMGGNLLVRMGNKLYEPSQFQLYQEETTHDEQSIFADPLFMNADTGDYRLMDNSPCPEAGIAFGK